MITGQDPTLRARGAVVSVGVRTVGVMDAGRHVCTWFDDGEGFDLLCACGARAVGGTEDEDLLLMVLAADPAARAVSA